MAAYFWPGGGIEPSIDNHRRSQRKDRAQQISVLWPVRNGRHEVRRINATVGSL
jgi:hypothetical protein